VACAKNSELHGCIFFACFAQWIIGVAIHRGGGLVISQTLDMAQGMKIPKYSEQFLSN